jgi:nucleoside-diphosphate-sugar epimerase
VYDVAEIAAFISEIHGAPIELQPVERLIRKVERQNLQADSRRLQTRYGWKPKYSVQDSMRYAHEWYTNL